MKTRSTTDLVRAVHEKAATLGMTFSSHEEAIRWALARAAGVGMVMVDPAPKGVCQGCRAPDRHLGRFVDDQGREWSHLCGGCKIRLTMTPRRRQALSALAKALLEAPIGDVIVTTGEEVRAAAHGRAAMLQSPPRELHQGQGLPLVSGEDDPEKPRGGK